MDSSDIISYILKSFLFILIFGSILFLAYATTKLVAAKASSSMKGRYISVIDSISLGADKRLYLVKVSNTFILLSSSGKKLEFLTIVPVENYEEIAENQVISKPLKTAGFLNTVNLSAVFEKVNNNPLFKKKDDENNNIKFKSNLERIKKVISSSVGHDPGEGNGIGEEKDREGNTNEK